MMMTPQILPIEPHQISLPHYAVIQIQGEDAIKYTNGQVTCDVIGLPIGQASMGAHCDPKGKVIAAFWLLKVSEDCLLMVYPDALKVKQLAEFKKYAIFSKITITDVSNQYHVLGIVCSDIKRVAELSSQSHLSGAVIPVSAQRFMVLTTEATSIYPVKNENVWTLCNIIEHIPTLSAEHQQEFIPQALNLDALNAISFTKGCYTGQETVARAKYRGANNRALFSLSSANEINTTSSTLTLEKKLGEQWRASGTIIQSIWDSNRIFISAVLPSDTDLDSIFRITEIENSELNIIK